MAWDPKKDPIVGGNRATGDSYTRSGLVVDGYGNVRVGKRAPGTTSPPKKGDFRKGLGPLSAEKVKKMIVTGKRPNWYNQQTQVRNWLKSNKGWVAKNWRELSKSEYGKSVLKNSGFRYTAGDKADLVQYKGDTIWKYGKAQPKPGGKTSPNGGTSKTSPNGGTSSGAGAAAEDPNQNLLQMAIQRLIALDPSAGQQAYDPRALLAGLTGNTQQQTALLRSQMADLQKQGQWNTDSIDKWFGQVGKSVDTARERGIKMTADLGGALASNNKGLIESIGGSAAMGASPVGQTMQQGQNTLAAMGAADSQFLNDMGPLLQGEGASLKAREVNRISQMRKDLQQELRSSITDGGTKRAELMLQIAQMNNQQGQQQFQNRASLAETLAGLAMSGQKLSSQQQQFVTKLIADQQAQQSKQAQAGAKTKVQQLNEWRDSLPSYEDAQAAGWGPVEGVPRQELVSYIRNRAREAGLNTRDPAVINAMIGAIQAYGGKVPPEWVKGWRG